MTATKSLKMLEKCFGESNLSRLQVLRWHKAFCDGREVIECLPYARPSIGSDSIVKVKETMRFL